jgi:transposase
MGTKEKSNYQKNIQNVIDFMGEDYKINYSLTNVKDSLHEGTPNYSGTIFIKKDDLNLRYNFEIIDTKFRFFNVGKIFGKGEEDKNGLEKIAELNKNLAINLNLQLIKKELETDLLQEAMSKKY